MSQSSGHPIELLVLQSTPFCNIDCSYCYLPNRNNRDRMDARVLSAALDRLIESGRLGTRLVVAWHAGEPLVLPPAYYREAMDLIGSRLSGFTRIEYNIQTNGTLISDPWCELLKSRNVQVGLSIDGPRQLHDRQRRTRGGAGTHEKVVAGLRRLHAHGVRFHVITVLTRESLRHADEIYGFYVETGATTVAFNIEEIEGQNRFSSLADPACEAEYLAFIERFHLLCRNGTMGVRELDHAFGALVSPEPGRTISNNQVEPFAIVSVAADGAFSTFSPELLGMRDDRWGGFVLGNVLTEGIDAAVASQKYRAIWSEIQAGIERCRSECSLFDVCGGGAPSNKLSETGRFDCSETLHCRYNVKLPVVFAVRSVEEVMGLKTQPKI